MAARAALAARGSAGVLPVGIASPIRLSVIGLALMAVPLSAAPLQNEYNMRLLKLPSLQQRAVLRRAILDDGNACGRVTVAAWRGPYANLQRWEAVCDRGGSYAVFIGLDSTVQVRDCPSLATLKLPVCRPVATPPAQKSSR